MKGQTDMQLEIMGFAYICFLRGERNTWIVFGTGKIFDRSLVNVVKSLGAYHLAKKSGNFGLNCGVPSEVLLFFHRNGTAENSLPFERILRFQAFPARFADETPERGMVRQSHPVGGSNSKNPLPLYNGYTNRIFATNGKHPLL